MGVKISAPGYRQVAGWPGGYRVATGWHHRRMTVIKINAITVPADSGDELARRFAARAGAVDNQDGFEGFELLKPTDERTTWLVVTRWRDEESFAAWLSSPAFGHGHRGAGGPPGGGQDGEAAARPVGVSSELWSYEVAGGSAARPS
jgi:heme-degrading monooxygenase HmoA